MSTFYHFPSLAHASQAARRVRPVSPPGEERIRARPPRGTFLQRPPRSNWTRPPRAALGPRPPRSILARGVPPPPPPIPEEPGLPSAQRMLGADYADCSGWPERRVYVEAQQWFTGPGADIASQSTHTHIGACMPYKQTISGGGLRLHRLLMDALHKWASAASGQPLPVHLIY